MKDFPFSFTMELDWGTLSIVVDKLAEIGLPREGWRFRHFGGRTFILNFKNEHDAIKARLTL